MNQGCVVLRVSGDMQAREERQLLNPRNSCPVSRSVTGKIANFLYPRPSDGQNKAVLKVHLGWNSQG